MYRPCLPRLYYSKWYGRYYHCDEIFHRALEPLSIIEYRGLAAIVRANHFDNVLLGR